MLERVKHAFAQRVWAMLGQVTQDVGWDDGAERAADTNLPSMFKKMFPHKISFSTSAKIFGNVTQSSLVDF
jgi:hypothetical protein